MPVQRQDANAMLIYSDNWCRTYRRDSDGKIVTDCSGTGGGSVTNQAPIITGGTVQVNDISSDTSIVLNDSTLTQGFTDPEGGALWVINPTVDFGTVQDFDGYIIYTPLPGYDGPVQLCYDITDGVNSINNCINFNVDTNEAPVGSALYTIGPQQENSTLTVDYSSMRFGFSDPEGVPLNVQNITFNLGSVSMQPLAANFTIPDGTAGQTGIITWEVSDGVNVIPVTKTFSITSEPNTPPSGSNNITIDGTLEDVFFFIPNADIFGDVTDADGDPLTITNLTPNRGTLSSAPGGYIYTPPSNYSGPVTLTATISDGTASINVGRNFTVAPVYDPPVDSLPNNIIFNTDEFDGSNSSFIRFLDATVLNGVTSPEGLPLSVTAINVSSGQGTVSPTVADPNADWIFNKEQYFVGDTVLAVTISDTQQTITVNRIISHNNVLSPPVYDTGALPNIGAFDLQNNGRVILPTVSLLEGIISPEGNPIEIVASSIEVPPPNVASFFEAVEIVGYDGNNLTLQTPNNKSSAQVTFVVRDVVNGLTSTFTRTFSVTVPWTKTFTWPSNSPAPEVILKRWDDRVSAAVGTVFADNAEAQEAVDLVSKFTHIYLRESFSVSDDIYQFVETQGTLGYGLFNFGSNSNVSQNIDFQQPIVSGNGFVNLDNPSGDSGTFFVIGLLNSPFVTLGYYNSSLALETMLTLAANQFISSDNEPNTIHIDGADGTVELFADNQSVSNQNASGVPSLVSMYFTNTTYVAPNVVRGFPEFYVDKAVEVASSPIVPDSTPFDMSTIARLRRTIDEFRILVVAENLESDDLPNYFNIIEILSEANYAAGPFREGDADSTAARDYINNRLLAAGLPKAASAAQFLETNDVSWFSAAYTYIGSDGVGTFNAANTRVYGMHDLLGVSDLTNPDRQKELPSYNSGNFGFGDFIVNNLSVRAGYSSTTKPDDKVLNYSAASGSAASPIVRLNEFNFLILSIAVDVNILSASYRKALEIDYGTDFISFEVNNVEAVIRNKQGAPTNVVLAVPHNETGNIRFIFRVFRDGSNINSRIVKISSSGATSLGETTTYDIGTTVPWGNPNSTVIDLWQTSIGVYHHEVVFGLDTAPGKPGMVDLFDIMALV